MLTWVAVGVGGALGSVARHGMNVLTSRLLGQPPPYATAAANLVGCAIIGVLAGRVASGALALSPEGRAFLFVGVLGGFTTFSSFGLDTFTLTQSGHPIAAGLNVLGQVALGLAAVAGGYYAAAS